MKNGGEYAKNHRIVGDHIGIDPLYSKSYMETLDNFKIKETQYDNKRYA